MKDLWLRRLACLLAGGLIGAYTPESKWWLVLGIFLLVAFRVRLWQPRDFFGPDRKRSIFILCVSIVVGFVYGQLGKAEIATPFTIDQVKIVGELKDWSVNDEGAVGVFQILEPVEIPSNFSGSEDFIKKKYRLRAYRNIEGDLPAGWDMVQPGDLLEFTGKIEQPKPPGTPGQFDLPLYYAVRGLSGGITAQGEAIILAEGDAPLSWQLRERMQKLLTSYPQAQVGLLEGILFGDTSRVPEEELERYRITGVYHVFSASGSNVAFLLLLCWGGLFFLPRPLRVGITIPVLVFYAVLCGGNPPILRATVMATLVLLGRLGKGRGNGLRGLLLAAFFLFLWQPLILKDIGFQLSFMATWGILVLSSLLEKVKLLRKWPKSIKNAVSMTSAAQIATLPLLISAFHRLSIIGLLANILVLSILGIIFELGILGVALSFIPPIALPLFQVSLWLLSWVSEVLSQLARLPWADVWVVNPGLLFWLGWYGGIAVLLVGKERASFVVKVWVGNLSRNLNPCRGIVLARVVKLWTVARRVLTKGKPEKLKFKFKDETPKPKRAEAESKEGQSDFKLLRNSLGIKGGRVLLALLLLLLLWSPWNTPGVLQVTFIDVGQGDCVLIETPKGRRLMVDTGPKTERFDAGERIIVPYLLNQGIRHLDALILTHPHADHVGGAVAVLKTIPVDWVGIPEDGLDWLGLAAIADGETVNSQWNGWGEGGLDLELVRSLENIKVEKLTKGDRLVIDKETTLSVLAPGRVLSGTKSDQNNNSLVLRLENKGGQSVLLTGDMEEEAMEELYRSGQLFDADLFKVPHHGSRYSLLTDMLDEINPQGVVIPVGRNSFGHPSPQVLRYWEERRVPVFRTDEHGTIEVNLDGVVMEVIPGRR